MITLDLLITLSPHHSFAQAQSHCKISNPQFRSPRKANWFQPLHPGGFFLNWHQLQMTTSEYAAERRSLRRADQKTNVYKVDRHWILESWSYYVKINFAKHQHDTERSQNGYNLFWLLSVSCWLGINRLCSATCEQLLAFSATFCTGRNLEQLT